MLSNSRLRARCLALLTLPGLLAPLATAQTGTAVLDCNVVGIGGDNAASRGIRFRVDQSFDALDVHVDGINPGAATFDVELRRSDGYVAPIEATGSASAMLPGMALSAPYPAVRILLSQPISVSGMETFTLKAVNISAPGSMFWEVAGIGNFPCPDAEVTAENNVAMPTLRTSATGLRVVDTGNAFQIGAGYCAPAVPNSTGTDGKLSATGSTMVADNDVTLVVDDLPRNSFGYYIVSQTQSFIMNPMGSQGHLCLGGSIGRYVGMGEIQFSGMSGTFSLAIDLMQTPQPTGFVPVAAGETWNFQAWHRDSVGGVATSNFTNGLAIAFV